MDGYSRAQIRLPQRTGQDISITYLDASPAHERAANRITINSAGDEVVSHDRYADRPLNVRLMNSMLPLHAGSYFGTIGKVLMMIASIAMPLFTITGWMLYLNRRRHKSEAHHAMETAQAIRTVHHNEPVLIAYATQSGYAESLAWHTANVLLQHGQPVTVKSLGDMVPEDLSQYRNALLLISTFGDGEPPTDAEAFAEAMAQSAALAPLRYGLLALGDREYEQYCAFGRAVDTWLQKSGATHLFESIELDGEDAAALELWYHQVSSHVEVEEK